MDINTKLNGNGDRRGMNPKSRENLEKRNLNGNNHASKDYSITSAVRKIIDEPVEERWLHVEDKGKGITWRQAIAKSLLVHALQGKQGAVSELLDRLEGKVPAPVRLADFEGKELVFKVVRDCLPIPGDMEGGK